MAIAHTSRRMIIAVTIQIYIFVPTAHTLAAVITKLHKKYIIPEVVSFQDLATYPDLSAISSRTKTNHYFTSIGVKLDREHIALAVYSFQNLAGNEVPNLRSEQTMVKHRLRF